MQQEAARKLSFTAKKTMQIAQQLYEGLDVGEEGTVGLITYMRTDATRVSNEAISAVRGLIKSEFGASYLPANPALSHRNRVRRKPMKPFGPPLWNALRRE